jgi:hypothetical protein
VGRPHGLTADDHGVAGSPLADDRSPATSPASGVRSHNEAMRTVARVVLASALTVTAAVLGLAPVAAGGCVGPLLGLGSTPPDQPASETPAPATVDRGAEVSVSGRWFFTGCSDTYVGGGCSGDGPSRPLEAQSPMTGVRLELTQGQSTWPLGTADAVGAENVVAWQVRIPDDARNGPATLTAAGADLPISITD